MRILPAKRILISLLILLIPCQSAGDRDAKYTPQERPAFKEG
jgi:hypothetical protein